MLPSRRLAWGADKVGWQVTQSVEARSVSSSEPGVGKEYAAGALPHLSDGPGSYLRSGAVQRGSTLTTPLPPGHQGH